MTYLTTSQEESSSVEATFAGKKSLTKSNEAPDEDDARNPSVRTQDLGEHVTG